VRNDLLEMIDDRSAGKATIVTSQLPIEHWHGWIGDETIADAMLDRLMQRAPRGIPQTHQSGGCSRTELTRNPTIDTAQRSSRQTGHVPEIGGHVRRNTHLRRSCPRRPYWRRQQQRTDSAHLHDNRTGARPCLAEGFDGRASPDTKGYEQSLEKAFRRRKRPVGKSWRMDEPYIRVKGEWRYHYRDVDKEGNTIDFLLRAHRDKAAARRYFEKSND
jgi:DDE domain/IstB-like ATP binding protein